MKSSLLAFLTAACVALPSLVHGADPSSLKGWGPYQFGMSIDDIAKIGRADASSHPNELLDSAMIGGVRYLVHLRLNGIPPRLDGISLTPEYPPADSAPCDQLANSIKSGLVQKYGEPNNSKGMYRFSFNFQDGSSIRFDRAPLYACDISIGYWAPDLPPLKSTF